MTTYYTELNRQGRIKLYCILQDGSRMYCDRTYTPKELKQRILTDKKVTIDLDDKVKGMMEGTR